MMVLMLSLLSDTASPALLYLAKHNTCNRQKHLFNKKEKILIQISEGGNWNVFVVKLGAVS